MQRADRVAARIERARSEGFLVKIRRRKGWDSREGFIVGCGAKWALVATIDDRIRLDGFSALRRRDITAVQRRHKVNEGFVRRALELQGEWPPPSMPDGIDLERTRGVIEGLARLFPLLAVMTEHEAPDVAFIGQWQQFDGKTFRLREVTPNAEWGGPRKRDWSHWSFGEVTRLDAGGGYETALAMVAGAPPAER